MVTIVYDSVPLKCQIESLSLQVYEQQGNLRMKLCPKLKKGLQKLEARRTF